MSTEIRTKFLDYSTLRKPKTEHCCVKCLRDLKPGQPYRLVHLFDYVLIVHPEGPQPPAGDVQIHPVGMDCARAIGMEWTREPDSKPTHPNRK